MTDTVSIWVGGERKHVYRLAACVRVYLLYSHLCTYHDIRPTAPPLYMAYRENNAILQRKHTANVEQESADEAVHV